MVRFERPQCDICTLDDDVVPLFIMNSIYSVAGVSLLKIDLESIISTALRHDCFIGSQLLGILLPLG